MVAVDLDASAADFIVGAVAIPAQFVGDDPLVRKGLLPLAERIRSQRRPRVIGIPQLPSSESGANELSHCRACLVLPWYERDSLDSYLVVLVGRGAGTAETWVPVNEGNPDELSALMLGSGHFGTLEEFFRVSAITRFRPGEGLPGRAQVSVSPTVFSSLGKSNAFLRAVAAESAGLEMGIAFPVMHPGGMDVAAILLGTQSASQIRVDLWSAGSPPLHRVTACSGTGRAAQQELATQLASLTASNNRPQALGGWCDETKDNAGFGFSWLAPSLTSVPRIITVVT